MALRTGAGVGSIRIGNGGELQNIASIDATTAAAITAGGVGGTFPDLTGTTNNGNNSVTTTRNIFGIDGVTQTATASSVSSITFSLPTGWRAELLNNGGAAGWRVDWFCTVATNGASLRMSVSAAGGNNLNYSYTTRYGNSGTGSYSQNAAVAELTGYGASNSTTGKRGIYGSIYWDGLVGFSYRGSLSFPYSSSNLFMRSMVGGELYSGYNLNSITLSPSTGNFGYFGGVLYPTAKFPTL
jgi:hypothetical protein